MKAENSLRASGMPPSAPILHGDFDDQHKQLKTKGQDKGIGSTLCCQGLPLGDAPQNIPNHARTAVV